MMNEDLARSGTTETKGVLTDPLPAFEPSEATGAPKAPVDDPAAGPLTGPVSRPLSVDLFAGVGGLSLGFEQAGFDNAAAVELDPIHACVHRFNIPQTPFLACSVVGLSGRELRRLAGLGDRPVDVVYGGARCRVFR